MRYEYAMQIHVALARGTIVIRLGIIHRLIKSCNFFLSAGENHYRTSTLVILSLHPPPLIPAALQLRVIT